MLFQAFHALIGSKSPSWLGSAAQTFGSSEATSADRPRFVRPHRDGYAAMPRWQIALPLLTQELYLRRVEILTDLIKLQPFQINVDPLYTSWHVDITSQTSNQAGAVIPNSRASVACVLQHVLQCKVATWWTFRYIQRHGLSWSANTLLKEVHWAGYSIPRKFKPELFLLGA